MARLLGFAKTQRRNPMNVVPMLSRLQNQLPDPSLADDLQGVWDSYQGFAMAYEDAMEELDLMRLWYGSMVERNLIDLVQRSVAVEEGRVAA
jgi:hypothetical protein